MKFVPINSDAAVGESFVSAIQRDVIVDIFFVALDILLCARQSDLFSGGKNKYDIAFGFDIRTLECSDRGKQRRHIPSIIATARSIDPTVFNPGCNISSG